MPVRQGAEARKKKDRRHRKEHRKKRGDTERSKERRERVSMATVEVVRSAAFKYKANPLSSHALIPLSSFLLHCLILTHLLMASPTPISTKDLESNSSSPSPPTPLPQPTWITTNNTTYVQAEPWAFRAVVQKLTGVPEDSPHKLPVSWAPRSGRAPPPPTPPASLMKRQKLQERRRAPGKLEIELGTSSSRCNRPHHHLWSSKPDQVAAGFSSPVSPMDPFFFNVSSPSPTTPSPSSLKKDREEEEEERAIAEKGFFYLHPSSRSGGEPPKLLALFPLHSPRDSSHP